MIKIICLGKIKEKYFIDALKEYEKRLTKYTKLEIIEIPDYVDNDIKVCLEKEKDLILKHIKEKDNIVILDINGKEIGSVEFSNLIEKELSLNSNITFIIGSSNGLHDEIKRISNKKLSFSKMTFPHQLFRIILLEQIYRSFRILNNESYHK
jgi:23S rRNA (pseudouridine1915-N3)-methyltransferase